MATVLVPGLQPADELALQLQGAGFPAPTTEYKFLTDRKFRFDFAWLDQRIAVEVEGGTWSGKSRHSSPAGYARDCQKYNLATLNGWQVYRFTSDQIRKGEALKFIQEVFKRF